MKKILSIFIISLLVWHTCTLPVVAATPSIIIDGGAVAGGGVAGGTNAKGDVVSVIASLVLASQGVKINAASGSTPIEFIEELLKNYADLVGITFETLCDLWLSNVKILADGAISIGMDSCQKIYQWLSYLKNGDMIYTPSLSDEYVLIGGVKCPVVDYENFIDVYADGRNDIYGYKNYSESKIVVFWSNDFSPKSIYILSKTSPIKIMFMYNGNSLNNTVGSDFGQRVGNFYFQRINSGVTISQWFIPFVPDGNNAIRVLSDLNFESNLPDESNLSGDPQEVNPDDFNISDNQVNILNPGLDLSALALHSGIDGIVQIKEYIDTLIRSVNGINDNVLKVNDGITGVLEELPIDLDIYDSTTVNNDTDSNNGMSIIDDSQYPDAETTQKYIKHMQFNLINVFPFCIPFDIVNLLSKLDVAPVTPHVNLSFSNPVLDDPIVFDLDFSQWNGVAAVVRNAELVAFVVGIAMVTRNLIRG